VTLEYLAYKEQWRKLTELSTFQKKNIFDQIKASRVNRSLPSVHGGSLNLLYINFACLSVCPFVTKKRQLDWTVRAQIFCGTTRDLKKGLLNILKCVSNKIRFFENFENP